MWTNPRHMWKLPHDHDQEPKYGTLWYETTRTQTERCYTRQEVQASLTQNTDSYTQQHILYMGSALTVQGCWWPRRWAPGSPPAARIRCWHHSQYHSLKASSLLRNEHKPVRNFFTCATWRAVVRRCTLSSRVVLTYTVHLLVFTQ